MGKRILHYLAEQFTDRDARRCCDSFDFAANGRREANPLPPCGSLFRGERRTPEVLHLGNKPGGARGQRGRIWGIGPFVANTGGVQGRRGDYVATVAAKIEAGEEPRTVRDIGAGMGEVEMLPAPSLNPPRLGEITQTSKGFPALYAVHIQHHDSRDSPCDDREVCGRPSAKPFRDYAAGGLATLVDLPWETRDFATERDDREPESDQSERVRQSAPCCRAGQRRSYRHSRARGPLYGRSLLQPSADTHLVIEGEQLLSSHLYDSHAPFVGTVKGEVKRFPREWH